MNKTQAKFSIFWELRKQAGPHFSFACLDDGEIAASITKAHTKNT